jgi:hypothetical protein
MPTSSAQAVSIAPVDVLRPIPRHRDRQTVAGCDRRRQGGRKALLAEATRKPCCRGYPTALISIDTRS